jgi:hypothetical protein
VHIQAKIIHTIHWESSSIRFLSQHQAGLSILPQVDSYLFIQTA